MVLLTLINISLDVSTSISWFVVKNTLYGTYCIGYYLMKGRYTPPPSREEILLLEINNKLDKLKKIEIDDDFILIEKDDI
jgi:hypothetical protein